MALPCLAPSGTGRYRVTVGAGIAGIQQFHGPQVDLTALQGQPDVIIHAKLRR
jgi:hypothetical protein